MKRYLNMELKRAFLNKRMVLALSFGVLLSIWHYLGYIFPLRNYIIAGAYPLSAYNKWLGGECYSLQSSLFYMLLPILCALPYGDSWAYDCLSSIGGQAIIRGGKRAFVLTKMLVAFMTGAVIAVLPLLFDFVLTSSTLPAITPKVGLGLSPIGTGALLGDLFYTHPLIYVLIYIGIDGLFLGVLNTFSIAARIFTANKYMSLLLPFICYMAIHSAGTTIYHFEICPSGFLRPCQQFETTWEILIIEIMFMMTVSLLAARKYIREEQGLL